MSAQLSVVESLRLHAEEHQGVEKRLGAGFAKAQRRGALAIDFEGAYHLIESVFADAAIVRDGLDVEQSSVGLKADGAKRGQVREVLADTEIPGVVDRGPRTQGPAFLWSTGAAPFSAASPHAAYLVGLRRTLVSHPYCRVRYLR